jgi:phage gp45-like
MYDLEQAAIVRGLIARGVVRGTNDGGGIQTADVTMHRDIRRTGVEVVSPWGLVSRPPSGSVMLMLAVGGDQGDMIGLPAGHPSRRMGRLKEGEVALHGRRGERVLIKQDGSIEIWSRETVTVKVRDTAEVTVDHDRIVAKLPAENSRAVVRPNYAKIAKGGQFVAVTAAQVVVSSPPIVGPDPEPAL